MEVNNFVNMQSCFDCNELRKKSEFSCAWCESVHRCSDGADRLREHWESNKCSDFNVTDQCGSVGGSDHTQWRTSMIKTKDGDESSKRPLVYVDPEAENSASSPGSVVSIIVSTILVLVLLGIAGGFLFLYGKRNPGGMAERIAMRMESSYKRFGGDGGIGGGAGGGGGARLDGLEGREFNNVDLENKHVTNSTTTAKDEEVNKNNNNSITISF